MAQTTEHGSDLGSPSDAAVAAGIEPADFGLADTDFGPGLITLAAALCNDRTAMDEAALVETVRVLTTCASWLQAATAEVVAEIAARRGGPTDPDAQLAAHRAEVEAACGPGFSTGREPEPRFWERTVLGPVLRLSERDAVRLVQTAVDLFGTGGGGRLPNTAAALAAGEISWRHAEAMSRSTSRLDTAAAQTVEVDVLSDPRAVTPGQVRHRARETAAQLCPPVVRDPVAGTASLWEQVDGTVAVAATLDPAGGRVLARAIDAYATVTGPLDLRAADQRRADALVEIGRIALDQLDPARAGAVRRTGRQPHLSVLVDTRTPAGTGPRAVLEAAGRLGPLSLTPGETDWLLCTGEVQHVAVADDGTLVGLGDVDKRMPGPRLRAEINLRDQGCRGPGCDRPPSRCVPHHVLAHADGGPTTADDLLSVCSVHHACVHRDGWTVTFDGTTAVWTDPHGRRYESPPPLARRSLGTGNAAREAPSTPVPSNDPDGSVLRPRVPRRASATTGAEPPPDPSADPPAFADGPPF